MLPRPGRDIPPLRRPGTLWLLWSVLLLVLIASAGSIGGPQGPGLALAAVVQTVIVSGWPAGVYLATAAGFGWLIGRAVPGATRHARFALGLATLLTLSHGLGVLGLLNAPNAVLICVVGVGALVWARRNLGRFRPPPGWLWIGLPGLALLLTAAASPPGALWASEYGAYDVLSYHLQLPQEWLRLGRVAPVEHNIYSFLPGYLEAAYAHLGWLSGAPTSPERGSAAGLLAGGGWRLMSAHYLHAGLAVATAWLVARLARRMALAAGLSSLACRVSGDVAGGLVLCTPWAIVVGSLAYNEMGVTALGAGALLAAARRTARPALQSVIVGLLVGVACCVKPTALFFVGIPAGVLLLRFLSWRDWGRAVAAGAAAGIIALSPWLIRNAVFTGNPVFPFATGLFGTGHWTAEQAARWAASHAVDGSLSDRLRLALWTDPATTPDTNPVARWRGVANPQWLLAFPAGLLSGLALLVGRRTRPISLGLLLGLAGQLASWLLLTHVQSRFLLPCILLLSPLVGLAAGAWRVPRLVGPGGGVAICLAQAAGAWMIFAGQRGGSPNALLIAGPDAFLGEPYSPELGGASPTAFVNHELPPDARVLLVGGATPLYLKRDTIYASVWDRPPALGVLAPEHPPSITDFGFVLVDFAELARQRGSGYLDPDVTPGVLDDLLAPLTPVREWARAGVRLYRVPGGSP